MREEERARVREIGAVPSGSREFTLVPFTSSFLLKFARFRTSKALKPRVEWFRLPHAMLQATRERARERMVESEKARERESATENERETGRESDRTRERERD